MNYSYFIGLVVGKKSLAASLVCKEEKELSHSSFANTPQGIKELLEWVSSYGVDLKQVLFCAENMGNYVIDLSLSSATYCFSLALVCPLAVKKSIGLERGKNDRVDARRLAVYALLHHRKLKLYHLPEKDMIRLRSWIIIRSNLVKEKVRLIKLKENLTYMAKVADVSESLEFVCMEAEHIEDKIHLLEKRIEEIILCNTALATNYKLLRSITGIGLINATILLCITDNFKRFSEPRKFACYCGVAPFEHSSGSSIRGRTQTSDLANKEIKVYLTRAAITAMRHDPWLKAYYKRKIKEGKHKAVVINAIRAKIIARCFAVIKRGTPFVKLVA